MVDPRLAPILDAMVQRIITREYALPGEDPLPVLKRKAPIRRQQMDPRKAITVAKSSSPETVTRWTFATIRTDYLIDVTIVTPYTGPGGFPDANLDDYALWRDDLVSLFSKPPLPGADGVFDLKATPATWLTPLGENSEWDWQAVQVTASIISSNS
jgi:hypothetical protein